MLQCLTENETLEDLKFQSPFFAYFSDSTSKTHTMGLHNDFVVYRKLDSSPGINAKRRRCLQSHGCEEVVPRALHTPALIGVITIIPYRFMVISY